MSNYVHALCDNADCLIIIGLALLQSYMLKRVRCMSDRRSATSQGVVTFIGCTYLSSICPVLVAHTLTAARDRVCSNCHIGSAEAEQRICEDSGISFPSGTSHLIQCRHDATLFAVIALRSAMQQRPRALPCAKDRNALRTPGRCAQLSRAIPK